MPIYEYNCKGCNHPFEALIQGSEKAACPACGNKDLEKRFSVFAVNDAALAKVPPSPCDSCDSATEPGGCPGSMG